jgi:hypothetical protein
MGNCRSTGLDDVLSIINDCKFQQVLSITNVPNFHDYLLKPDLTVVVRGQEFHHYSSQMLDSGGAYFNSLFRSKMMRNKSTEQVVIDDCTPEEWQLISHFFKPAHLSGASMGNITVSNVEMFIPLFDKFLAHMLLSWCDKIYCIKVFTNHRRLGNRAAAPVGSPPSMLLRSLKENLCYVLDAKEIHQKYSMSLKLCPSAAQRLPN